MTAARLVERIQQPRASAREIVDIARDHGEIVDQRGGRDQLVEFVRRIGYAQPSAKPAGIFFRTAQYPSTLKENVSAASGDPDVIVTALFVADTQNGTAAVVGVAWTLTTACGNPAVVLP